MILEIATIPDPILKKPAERINRITDETLDVISNMLDTMHCHRNCVGIAAPQVNKSIRLITIDISLHPKKHLNHGLLVLINPIIVNSEGSMTGREGCLSVPDFTANITRANKVFIIGLNREGKRLEVEAEGFEAVVLQHEIDHLNGIVFLDRVASIKTDIFRRVSVGSFKP